MHFKAIIFDMDGVLIDSELYWDEEGRNFFGKRNIPYTKQLKAQLVGHSMRENMLWVKQEFGFSESVEELCEERVKLTDHIYTQASGILPGVETLLPRLRAHGFKTAIASGSFLYRIETIVQRFHWENYFDTLVSTDHVNFVGKPDPAIYLYAAKVLHVQPADCVVVEDSINGLQSAQAAGMACIAVPNPRWSWGDFSSADSTVESLEDPKLFAFLEL